MAEGKEHTGNSVEKCGQTFSDLLWRVFGTHAAVNPLSSLLFLLGLVLLWASSRTSIDGAQIAILVCSGVSLLSGLFLIAPNAWKTLCAKERYTKEFSISRFEPDAWRAALRLPHEGKFIASGWICLENEKEEGSFEYESVSHLEVFSGGDCAQGGIP